MSSTLKLITWSLCHSFIPNDSDFSNISDALKHERNIYIPLIITLIDKCKKKRPFNTVKIGGQFIELDDVNSILTNREKGESGCKVNWMKIKWMKFTGCSTKMEFKRDM